jgi:hypothetical protein
MNDSQKARNFVEFTHGSTRYRCTPKTALQIRKTLEKMPKHKPEALSSVNLRRDYPIFEPSMKTADYLALYGALNSRLLLTTLEYAHADRVAPMLDATQPEALEELNTDYTPPLPKPKKRKGAEVMEVIQSALNLLRAGDVHMAEFVLRKAIT